MKWRFQITVYKVSITAELKDQILWKCVSFKFHLFDYEKINWVELYAHALSLFFTEHGSFHNLNTFDQWDNMWHEGFGFQDPQSMSSRSKVNMPLNYICFMCVFNTGLLVIQNKNTTNLCTSELMRHHAEQSCARLFANDKLSASQRTVLPPGRVVSSDWIEWFK